MSTSGADLCSFSSCANASAPKSAGFVVNELTIELGKGPKDHGLRRATRASTLSAVPFGRGKRDAAPEAVAVTHLGVGAGCAAY